MIDLFAAMSENPLIAILRGLESTDAEPVADVLIIAGYRIIEVPLNSLQPLVSISRIAKRHGDRAIVGARTVLTVADICAVEDAGGRIIVSPNMNVDVRRTATARGLQWGSGVMTPTEAFAAIELGAPVLKILPAEMVSPAAVAAKRAVLPKEVFVAIVGGITPTTTGTYRAAGANGFRLVSALFKPGYSLDGIAMRARAFTDALEDDE